MKAMFLTMGVLLVVGGIFSLATGGFSFQHQKNDLNVGPVQISHESTRHVPVAPIVSVVAILAGGGLIFSVADEAFAVISNQDAQAVATPERVGRTLATYRVEVRRGQEEGAEVLALFLGTVSRREKGAG